MSKSLLLLVAVSSSAWLCACGFMTPAQQYAGDRKADSAIAVVRSHQGSLLGEDYHATISAYTHEPDGGPSLVKRFGLPGFTDYPHEIHLDPGVYVLELYCFKSLSKPTYRPTLEMSVKAGYAYTVKCDATRGQATAFVSQEVRPL